VDPHPPQRSQAGGTAAGDSTDDDFGGWRPTELGAAVQRVLALAGQSRPAIARRLGLNESEVWAMEHLMVDEVGPGELARRLHISPAATTVLVDRLERMGHVVRTPDPGDRRRVSVEPTAQGRAAVLAELVPLLSRLTDLDQSLSARDRGVVTRYLEDLAAILEGTVLRGE